MAFKLTSKKESKMQTGALGAPDLPQVDLLPPEIRDGRRLKAHQRRLSFVVVGVLVFAVVAVGGVEVLKINAESRLTNAQSVADELAHQKKEYSVVTGVIKSIIDTKAVRDFSLTTEVSWAPYIQAIAAVLPEGVTIDSFDIEQAGLAGALSSASDPVIATGLGTITFVAQSASIPKSSDWADALNTVPGFQDASIQSMSLGSDSTTNKPSYAVNVSVQINQLALANRVFKDADPDSAASDGTTSTDTKEGK